MNDTPKTYTPRALDTTVAVNRLHQHALDHWGEKQQIDEALRKLGGLVVALGEYSHNKNNLEKTLRGLAEAETAIGQLRVLFWGHRHEINHIKHDEIRRLAYTLSIQTESTHKPNQI
ncbi:MAG: hypothetical protein CMB99_16260 [Flavobacteriaceae bacterium]|nr:hypothetical protein [Flavobacteriaceae bacterium]|tara:strand:+ start:9953 stop:10303 length:351 start_codon:yes stop_codon:yes gene_type:complete